jgi:hypothetical protein
MMETVSSSDLRALVAEELERVLASEYFRNSKQAERLMRYLVANSLEERDDLLRERVIGEKVFGRQPKYDSNSDSIVRVWANHLRKRLAQYYQAEVQSSGVRFAMRPGAYRVEFQPVVEAVRTPVPAVPVEPVQAPIPSPRFSGLLMVSALSVVLAVACIWLALENRQLRTQVREPKTQMPLNSLWTRMFGGKRGAEIVLADSNLSLFQDLLHKPVSLQDYIHHNYLLMGADQAQPALSLLMTRRYTSTADVDVLRRTLLLAGPDSGRLEVNFARDFSPDDLKSRNVILVGSKRANPWVEPFEPQMNFRFDYNRSPGSGFIVNAHPRSGEQAAYSVSRTVEETTESFGLLAFQPNLAHTGSVLIVAGLGMQGTLAAGELATNPELFKQVVDLFGVNERTELPYFEVVLKAEMIGSTVHGFKIVAWRKS